MSGLNPYPTTDPRHALMAEAIKNAWRIWKDDATNGQCAIAHERVRIESLTQEEVAAKTAALVQS
jgi:hypothetical protein